MKTSAKKNVPKAQLGSIVKNATKTGKTVSKVAKTVNKTNDAGKTLSQFQKMRVASGKPITNLTMKEQMAKKALQEAIKKRTGTSTKKLTKEQQYLKDVMDSYRKKGGSVKLKKAQEGGQTVGNESKKEKNLNVLKNLGMFTGAGAISGIAALNKDIRSAMARAKERRANKKITKEEAKAEKQLAKNKK